MAKRWNPWETLKQRRHLTFERRVLPPGMSAAFLPLTDLLGAIVIDQGLHRIERCEALAHELVHEERGGGACRRGVPPMLEVLASRDEAQVDDEVARRLIPLDELEAFCVRHAEVYGGVSAQDVAGEFERTPELAQRALDLLVRSSWRVA